MHTIVRVYRSVLIVAFFATLLPYSSIAQSNSRLDPKKLTKDLDQKSSALAEEEARLLASLEGGETSKPAPQKAVAEVKQENPRASIDLHKVAETISQHPVPAPVKKIELQPEVVAPAKPVKVIQSESPSQPEVQKVIKQEIIREIVKESDPKLKQEIQSMGNLFSQWQHEFEKKHASLLKSQESLANDVDARLLILENGEKVVADPRSAPEYDTALADLRKEVERKQASLVETQESIETRISTLEKGEHEIRAVDPAKEVAVEMEKFTKEYAELKKSLKDGLSAQDDSIKALRLADGQLKHRMAAAEGQVTDAVGELDGVKQSVSRIEVSLNELSDQFIDSLKYRPHAVYQAPQEWSDDTDDVAYDWGKPGPRFTYLPHNAVMSDMPMVTVTEETANLWSGPEEDDKIVTTIRRGGQLAVEATEHDWYRIILADGRRAWIPARSVIHNNPSGRPTALRVASATR